MNNMQKRSVRVMSARASYVLALAGALVLFGLVGCSGQSIIAEQEPEKTSDRLLEDGAPCGGLITCDQNCTETAWESIEGPVTIMMCAGICGTDAYACQAGEKCLADLICARICTDDSGCSDGSVCRLEICSPSCLLEASVCPGGDQRCYPSGHCVAEPEMN